MASLMGKRVRLKDDFYDKDLRGKFGTIKPCYAGDSYAPVNEDGSDKNGNFWIELDGGSKDDYDFSNWACAKRDMFEVNEYIVRGSYGELYLDAAGNVERYVDADGDNEYGNIAKFDLTTLSGREVDIIDTGFWQKDGVYVSYIKP